MIFLYLSYAMPTLAGFFAFGRSWTKMGPFNLGAATYKTLAAFTVLGVAMLLWIGVQPPNEKALTATAATTALLLTAWWAGVGRVFRGPPVMSVASEVAPQATPGAIGLAPQRSPGGRWRRA